MTTHYISDMDRLEACAAQFNGHSKKQWKEGRMTGAQEFQSEIVCDRYDERVGEEFPKRKRFIVGQQKRGIFGCLIARTKGWF